MRTLVKICGITRPADAAFAVAAGADTVGLVFVSSSPRHVGIEQARNIRAVIPPGTSVVALFRDPSVHDVRNVVETVRPDILQFHGRESAAFCAQFGEPWIKTIGMGTDGGVAGADLPEMLREYRAASALLLDGHAHGADGGTGQRLDWHALPPMHGRAIVLAGGLTPANVAGAIATVRPYAVDVSSGVEDRPGIKNHVKIEKFIQEVHRADALTSGTAT